MNLQSNYFASIDMKLTGSEGGLGVWKGLATDKAEALFE